MALCFAQKEASQQNEDQFVLKIKLDAQVDSVLPILMNVPSQTSLSKSKEGIKVSLFIIKLCSTSLETAQKPSSTCNFEKCLRVFTAKVLTPSSSATLSKISNLAVMSQLLKLRELSTSMTLDTKLYSQKKSTMCMNTI